LQANVSGFASKTAEASQIMSTSAQCAHCSGELPKIAIITDRIGTVEELLSAQI
jgi:hypothetical protein